MKKLSGFIGGLILLFVAYTSGCKVSSWIRSEDHNQEVGGVENSAHLWGGAIDVSEIPDAALVVLKMISTKAIQHDTGSGMHWHFESGARTIAILTGFVGIVIYLWNKGK